jgi:cephalosporin-C deacetylase-like acetyl esterase
MQGYSYSDAWKAIIRPPRDKYSDDELGPKFFSLGEKKFQRSDFDLKNERNLTLKCSLFEPIPEERKAKELPCIIYLHGNSSSRIESIPYVRIFLPSSIQFFCLDFSGSGKSDGEYISLGFWEREDVKTVVTFLRSTGRVSTIGLWGRSMGAATALLHSDRDPSIAGLVLDSPFSNLPKLTEELFQQHAEGVPGFVYSMLNFFVKKSIKSRAFFDIEDLNPLGHVDQAFIPALFIVAKGDNFIAPSHGIALYEKYAGDKNLIQVNGDHNSQRPEHAIISVYIFFYNTLQVSKMVPGAGQMEVPNISKLEYPHAIPQPYEQFEITSNLKELNAEDANDEELKLAMKLSMESYQIEKSQKKN